MLKLKAMATSGFNDVFEVRLSDDTIVMMNFWEALKMPMVEYTDQPEALLAEPLSFIGA